jgi:hypothetical protein
MVQATEVFTPTDVPTLTYVKRGSRNFEADLSEGPYGIRALRPCAEPQ